MDKICDMMEKLIDHLDLYLQDMDNANTHEAYEVVDIIKDLAETKKYCMEAKYYEHVIEAMEGKDIEEIEHTVQSVTQKWPGTQPNM